MSKNDLEAAFRNITKLSQDDSFSPFPTEDMPDNTENIEDHKDITPEVGTESRIEEGLLKRKEQKELRNVRKQFIITETLNNKLKEKSKELNLSENEVICQLLAIM